MLYAMQAIAYTAAMLLIYVLFLRSKAHHALSRNYLLLCAIVPMVLPLLQLPPIMQQQLRVSSALSYTLPEVSIGTLSATHSDVIEKGLPAWIIIYALIAILFIVMYGVGLVRIFSAIKKCTRQSNAANTVVLNTGFGPGSFGKYIFFPGSEVNAVILAHEEAHIRLRHSYDIVLVSLLQAVCWPNIFLYLIKKELKEVHEFQADQAVNADTETYTALILSTTFNTSPIALMHSFINHPIKRRIMMLRKNGTGSSMRALVQVVIAVGLLSSAAVIMQSCDKKASAPTEKLGAVTIETDTVVANKKIDTIAVAIEKKKEQNAFQKADIAVKKQSAANVFDATKRAVVEQKVADIMPRFIGDGGGLQSFIAKELRYPENARAKKIEGKVIVKFTVTKTGKVINPTVLKSPDPELSKAALDVIAKMPDWIPAQTKDGTKIDQDFYQPIMFQL